MSPNDDLPGIGNIPVGDSGIGLAWAQVSNSPENGGLGWIFRPLPTGDVGIDAQMEIAAASGDRDVASGRILGAQIKSGESFFERDDGESWSVYVAAATVNYWHAYSVPVILILVDPAARQCYWTRGDAAHERAGASYRIRVPKANVLNARSRQELAEIAEDTTEAGRRLARLEADVQLMRLLDARELLAVEVQHWWNKSGSRADVYIGYVTEYPFQGEPPGLEVIARWSAAGNGTVEFVEAMFPWADVEIDLEFRKDREHDLYAEYLAEVGTYDHETGQVFDGLGRFEEWLERRRHHEDEIPYEVLGGGEVGCYRFRIGLNDVGRSFLHLYDYLHRRDQLEGGS